MPEFTIEIDTHEGTTRAEQVLERLAELLVADDAILGPAASLDTESGIVGAIFQVEADSFEHATQIAVEHFSAALLRALLDEMGKTAASEAPIDKVLIERVAAREPALA